MVNVGISKVDCTKLDMLCLLKIATTKKLTKHFIIPSIYTGEMSIFYLFTRYRFNWGEVEYSMFSTYSMITGLIGIIKICKIKHRINSTEF